LGGDRANRFLFHYYWFFFLIRSLSSRNLPGESDPRGLLPQDSLTALADVARLNGQVDNAAFQPEASAGHIISYPHASKYHKGDKYIGLHTQLEYLIPVYVLNKKSIRSYPSRLSLSLFHTVRPSFPCFISSTIISSSPLSIFPPHCIQSLSILILSYLPTILVMAVSVKPDIWLFDNGLNDTKGIGSAFSQSSICSNTSADGDPRTPPSRLSPNPQFWTPHQSNRGCNGVMPILPFGVARSTYYHIPFHSVFPVQQVQTAELASPDGLPTLGWDADLPVSLPGECTPGRQARHSTPKNYLGDSPFSDPLNIYTCTKSEISTPSGVSLSFGSLSSPTRSEVSTSWVDIDNFSPSPTLCDSERETQEIVQKVEPAFSAVEPLYNTRYSQRRRLENIQHKTNILRAMQQATTNYSGAEYSTNNGIRANFKADLRKDEPIRSFRCGYSGCNRAFKRKEHHKRHIAYVQNSQIYTKPSTRNAA
jgi:hypothetical protein